MQVQRQRPEQKEAAFPNWNLGRRELAGRDSGIRLFGHNQAQDSESREPMQPLRDAQHVTPE